ncbi:MAG TPA: crosslink repair DNA glycosylase YcaQ family protein [Kofleriaceae bacterium]|nr:crosslink repair DNA glycosylase YcaQ family protein [Kofleriaceae bacterium]
MPSAAPRSTRRRPGPAHAAAPELSARDARQIALAAQRLGARPAKPNLRHISGLFDAITLIQIDSVNVVCRSQELPLWARLGAHARDALPALCKRGAIFEYWAHEASLMPVELHPLLRWRMTEARDKAWRFVRSIAQRDPGYVDAVRAEVHARGQLIARDLEARTAPRKRASWWSWDDRKRALAYLFWAGEIAALRSPTTFERIYAPPDRVLPAHVLAVRTPTPDDARRELLLRSARALGVATLRDLADYFRITVPVARPLVAELAHARRLIEVRVEGWREPAYLHPDAPAPGPVAARALLSPFDSLIWERRRTERLFNFRYRIEIYTPAHRRTHGYYVLPFLHGDALVARVDVKADRAAGALLVHAAYGEPGAPADTAPALADELTAFAGWLGLDRVSVGARGDLARPLRAQLRAPAAPRRRS